MRYTGQFTTKDGRLITVEIWNTTEDYDENVQEIGSDGLFFNGDPVTITRDIDDSFSHVIIHQAEISLKTGGYIGDELVAKSSDEIQVRIWEGNTLSGDSSNLIFFGYAEPLVFSQPYVTRLDEFTITANDRLGQLQYYKYKDIYTKAEYNNYLQNSGYVSFLNVLNDAISHTTLPSHIYYDESIGVTNLTRKNVFSALTLNDSIIIGDEVDDVLDCKETIEEVLKYLNLHIMALGDDYYIFNWDTIRKRRNTAWIDLLSSGGTEYTPSAAVVKNFDTSLHAGADANLTMDEIYTQVTAKASIEDIDTVIESPLDSDLLNTSMYDKRLYMTELRSHGEGDSAFDAFTAMMNNQGTNYDACSKVDWYAQFCYNKNWKTYITQQSDNVRREIRTLADYDSTTDMYVNQDKLWRAIYNNPCSAGIFKFGHIEQSMGRITDNAPVHKLEMTPYLCISLGGNMNHTISGHQPNESKLYAAAPIAEYHCPFNGGSFSSPDSNVTNYLVFSGKFMLQKKQKESVLYQNRGSFDKGTWKYFTVPSKDNDDGMYYTRKWWTAWADYNTPTVTTQPSFHPPRNYIIDREGGIYTTQVPSEGIMWYFQKAQWHSGGDYDYKYEYTREGNNNDEYYKLPLLECELIIGNKRLIEYSWGRKLGDPATVKPEYRWVTVGEEPYVYYKDMNGATQYAKITTFSLGIDPKIDDCIIGPEHEMANNVDWRWNIDADGTAIPIPGGQNIAGDVTFRILGPINSMWHDVDCDTRSWWLLWAHHYDVWSDNIKYILSQCETMFVKDFECKLYTPNQDGADTSGKEIIYMSAEDNRVQKKDDIEFKFITQPDLLTFLENDCEYKQCRNAVMTSGGTMVSKMYSAIETGADVPEKLYVTQYYNEYHTGKLLLQGTYHVNEKEEWRNIFNLPTIDNKKFYIQKISHSLKYNSADVTFKEV